MEASYETEQPQRELGDNLAEFLTSMRDLSGLTQAQMAKAIGLSEGTFSNYINDLRVPGAKHAEVIKIFFDLGDHEVDRLTETPDPVGRRPFSVEDYAVPKHKITGDGTDFMPSGECKGVSVDVMMPFGRRGEAVAKLICAGCSNRDYCLDYAVAYGEEGVWGGTTKSERMQIAKRRESPAAQ